MNSTEKDVFAQTEAVEIVSKLSCERVKTLASAKSLLPFYIQTQEVFYKDNLRAFYGSLRYIFYYLRWEPLKLESYLLTSLKLQNIKVDYASVMKALNGEGVFSTKAGWKVNFYALNYLDKLIEDASGSEVFNFEKEIKEDFQRAGRLSDFESLKKYNGFVSASYMKNALETVAGKPVETPPRFQRRRYKRSNEINVFG